MSSVLLPAGDGKTERYTLLDSPVVHPEMRPRFNRVAFAAAHIVAKPSEDLDTIDWESTLKFREHLFGLGFGIAEAMDTAQRGAGLSWEQAKRLIAETCALAKNHCGARVACGVNTETVSRDVPLTLDEITRAYIEQMDWVLACGGQPVIMASRDLCSVAREPDDYKYVYSRLLSHSSEPVILHWLGQMFDPKLTGYWGGDHLAKCLETCNEIIAMGNVDGIKLSLLDQQFEENMRANLPRGVRMYTGDDFNFADLILGDGDTHSDGLLGIFDPIAQVASNALSALAGNRVKQYFDLLRPTVELSRKIFEAPTYNYKTGVVFLAYLNGHQDHFQMVRGAHTVRSLSHLCEVFKLADRAGVFQDSDLVSYRFSKWMNEQAS